MGKTTGGAVKIYQITYIFGITLSAIIYFAANKLYPPPGLGIDEPFHDGEIVEGEMIAADKESNSSLKEATISQKQINEDTMA